MSDPTDPPAPTVFASLRSFAYDPVSAQLSEPGEPIDIAEEYHEASKIRAAFPGQALGPAGRELATVADSHLALGRKALTFAGLRTELPPPAPLPVELGTLIRRRRSGLPQRCAPITQTALAGVLALSAGAAPDRPGFRVTPSAGALYPLDVLLIAHAVEGLPRGSYVYDAIGHTLLRRGAVDPAVFHRDAAGELGPPHPAATLAIVATFARSRAKYGLRGYRFALLEAGHVAQAALTAATALGLASLPWGGFIDDAVDTALDLDGVERSCVYLVGISANAADETSS